MKHKSKLYQVTPSYCNEKESKGTVWMVILDVNMVEKREVRETILNFTKNKNKKTELDSLLDRLSQEFPSSNI